MLNSSFSTARGTSHYIPMRGADRPPFVKTRRDPSLLPPSRHSLLTGVKATLVSYYELSALLGFALLIAPGSRLFPFPLCPGRVLYRDAHPLVAFAFVIRRCPLDHQVVNLCVYGIIAMVWLSARCQHSEALRRGLAGRLHVETGAFSADKS